MFMTTLVDRKNKMGKPGGAARVVAIAKASLLLIPLFLATPAVSSAYTDPGTGAFVYQAAYAAFLGGTFYLRKVLDYFWARRRK